VARSLAALALVAAAACAEAPAARMDVDRAQIEIVTDSVALKTGAVGEARWKTQATYALVEARNHSEKDLEVTLAGHLVGGDEKWPVRRESLRIPAGGSRLFALVDDKQAARPQATGARPEVVGAMAVGYSPPFMVTDGKVVMDQGRAVAAAYLTNTAKRVGSVILIGAFFDQAGLPLGRTSTLFRMDGGGKRGVQLVGPTGSRSAYLFVGEYVY